MRRSGRRSRRSVPREDRAGNGRRLAPVRLRRVGVGGDGGDGRGVAGRRPRGDRGRRRGRGGAAAARPPAEVHISWCNRTAVRRAARSRSWPRSTTSRSPTVGGTPTSRPSSSSSATVGQWLSGRGFAADDVSPKAYWRAGARQRGPRRTAARRLSSNRSSEAPAISDRRPRKGPQLGSPSGMAKPDLMDRVVNLAQAARARLPLERDLRRLPLDVGLRPPRRAAQAQREGRLVAVDGAAPRRHRRPRRRHPHGAQGLGGERPRRHLHRPAGRLPQLQGALPRRPAARVRRVPQLRRQGLASPRRASST